MPTEPLYSSYEMNALYIDRDYSEFKGNTQSDKDRKTLPWFFTKYWGNSKLDRPNHTSMKSLQPKLAIANIQISCGRTFRFHYFAELCCQLGWKLRATVTWQYCCLQFSYFHDAIVIPRAKLSTLKTYSVKEDANEDQTSSFGRWWRR